MPLLPPADYMAPVPLKRKRDTSAEPKRDPTKRAHTRIPDEAKLWLVDFHAYHARVHGKTLAYNVRRAKHMVPELFGPWQPDAFRRWHDGGAPNAYFGGRPPVELPPFDSVLCLGGISGEPAEAWESRIKWFFETRYLKDLDRIDGEPMEFEWTICPGFTTFGNSRRDSKV